MTTPEPYRHPFTLDGEEGADPCPDVYANPSSYDPMVPRVDMDKVVQATHLLLQAIGEDPTRPGLRDTPSRVARFWREFVDHDPGRIRVRFEAVTADQMVVVTGIRVWSLCEHHLLPFAADVSVAYITGDHVLGLSKFARIAHHHAHRLQIQERLVEGIANDVAAATGTQSVAVLARGVHLCMVMRGVHTHGIMTSSAVRGLFRSSTPAREEFLRLATAATPATFL